MTNGPFAGLKVLELSRFIAVPLCGQMLAEGGADVIKVDDFGGDQTRYNGPIRPFAGRQYFNKDRGKRSLAAKVSGPELLAAVQVLAAKAGIVFTGFAEYLKQAFAQGKTWAEVIEDRGRLLPHKVMRAYHAFFATQDGMVGIARKAGTLRLKVIELMGIDDRWTTEPGWLPEDAHAYETCVNDQAAATFRTAPTAHWLVELEKRGLSIAPVRHSDELFFDEQVRANGFFARVEHEVLGPLTAVAPPIRLSQTPITVRPPVPRGENTRDALQEAGQTDAHIDSIFARGVVRQVSESVEELP